MKAFYGYFGDLNIYISSNTIAAIYFCWSPSKYLPKYLSRNGPSFMIDSQEKFVASEGSKIPNDDCDVLRCYLVKGITRIFPGLFFRVKTLVLTYGGWIRGWRRLNVIFFLKALLLKYIIVIVPSKDGWCGYSFCCSLSIIVLIIMGFLVFLDSA